MRIEDRGYRVQGVRWLVFMAAAFALPLRAGAQDIGLEIGTPAPAALVETLDGKPFDLAEYVGKTPMVIEFWALWCGNCKQLEPTFKAAHARYGDRVKFITMAVSVNQSPERVKAYVERYQIPGEVYFDRRGQASGAYDAPATSYVVVVDAAGKVVYTGLGGRQDLNGAIQRALRNP
jgi:thiol-disulfide isomerase/thioredoxin